MMQDGLQIAGTRGGRGRDDSSPRTHMRERERCLDLDKLIGVPICLRFRRWPSDVTAALFFCVCACVSMLYNIYILPTSSWPPSSLLLPYPSPPIVSALRTLCIPSILAVIHFRMILSCLLLSLPSVVRFHVFHYGSLDPYDKV
jgi:hypothetical protein